MSIFRLHRVYSLTDPYLIRRKSLLAPFISDRIGDDCRCVAKTFWVSWFITMIAALCPDQFAWVSSLSALEMRLSRLTIPRCMSGGDCPECASTRYIMRHAETHEREVIRVMQ